MARQFKVRIRTSAKELGRKLTDADKRQIPFAVASGLTSLAFEARDTIRKEMPFRFRIRNKRVVKGVAVRKARKSDWKRKTIHSAVGTRDRFMVPHELGGIKRPRGSMHIAIPTKIVAKARTSGGRIPKRLRPREAIGSGRARKSRTARGGFIRLTSKALRRKRKNKLGLLFLLRTRVRIEPRWRFRETAEGEARLKYGAILRKKFAFALATVR